MVRMVTFREFRDLARKRGWTVDFLVEHFRGKFGDRGDVRRLFEDIMHQRRFNENLIPYRSVITFFETELGYHQAETGREHRCACGCGMRVFDRRKWASETCRKRGQRRQVRDRANTPEKTLCLQGVTRDISGVPVGTPTPRPEPGTSGLSEPLSEHETGTA